MKGGGYNLNPLFEFVGDKGKLERELHKPVLTDK
jgi:hypothetical protein